MKRIAIFGATGGVGLHVTEVALKRGLHIKALLRDPSKLPEHLRSNIEIIQGDVTNITDVQQTVEGQDAVIVTLGTRNDLSPTTVLSEGMKNIIAAMKKNGIECVSVCLSAFLFYAPEKVPTRFSDLNADHQRMLDYLKASGLKWIAILPPHLTDNLHGDYTVSHGSSPGRAIAKCDLAAFMLDSLSDPAQHNQLCGIATNVNA
ncbi:flavin reductase (NADPH) isoform X2 [Zootermopsis nevadensis]|uniref:flavin reductase (NADPH) isoform X2 n=1 Tax=Zootermopsis nevadensis TaxID=136037 RepID=UPI000B8EB3B4|nr:flavin reductase (NADPH) isoform X2 [Zootermopsis nevadensis]